MECRGVAYACSNPQLNEASGNLFCFRVVGCARQSISLGEGRWGGGEGAEGEDEAAAAIKGLLSTAKLHYTPLRSALLRSARSLTSFHLLQAAGLKCLRWQPFPSRSLLHTALHTRRERGRGRERERETERVGGRERARIELN